MEQCVCSSGAVRALRQCTGATLLASSSLDLLLSSVWHCTWWAGNCELQARAECHPHLFLASPATICVCLEPWQCWGHLGSSFNNWSTRNPTHSKAIIFHFISWLSWPVSNCATAGCRARQCRQVSGSAAGVQNSSPTYTGLFIISNSHLSFFVPVLSESNGTMPFPYPTDCKLLKCYCTAAMQVLEEYHWLSSESISGDRGTVRVILHTWYIKSVSSPTQNLNFE